MFPVILNIYHDSTKPHLCGGCHLYKGENFAVCNIFERNLVPSSDYTERGRFLRLEQCVEMERQHEGMKTQLGAMLATAKHAPF